MTIFVEFFENFKIVFMMKCMNCLCVMVLFGALTACSEKPQNVLTEEEKAARSAAIQKATLFATEVPLHTMQASFKVFGLCRAMAEEGNPNSVSDAGVGVLAARTAVLGAGLNVKINASGLKDKATAERLIAEADTLIAKAKEAETEIMKIVEAKL